MTARSLIVVAVVALWVAGSYGFAWWAEMDE